MTAKIQAIRGMEDVLPEASPLWEKFEDACRTVFEQYGYRNMRTPIVEPTPLFVKHRVEDHLSQIYSPVVPLRSGQTTIGSLEVVNRLGSGTFRTADVQVLETVAAAGRIDGVQGAVAPRRPA